MSGSGVFAQGRVDIGTSVLFRETSPAVSRTHSGSRLRVRRDRVGDGRRIAGGPGDRRRRERTRGAAGQRERRLARAWMIGSRRTPPRRRPDAAYDEIWSNPPIRIGKDALHELLLPLAAPAAARRPGRDGGRQEPRRRLAAAVAGGAGLPHRAARQCQGLPRPRIPSGLDRLDQQGVRRHSQSPTRH